MENKNANFEKLGMIIYLNKGVIKSQVLSHDVLRRAI